MNYLFKNRRVIAFILALVCFLSFDFALLAEDISSEIYESALEPGPSVETETPEEEEPEEKIISEVISSEIQEEPEASEEPVASEEPQEEPGIEEKTEEEVKEEVETVKEEVKEVFLEDDDTDDGKKNGDTKSGETSEEGSSEIKEDGPASSNIEDKEPEEEPSKSDISDEPSETKDGEGAKEPEDDPESGTKAGDDTVTYTVRFRNRDGIVIETRTVEEGAAIGTLPDTIAREDYIAYWAIGTASQGAQGTVWTPGERITSSYVVNSDLDIIPDYDPIVYTITFYNEDKSTVIETKTVDVSTSYCLNDIPAVPTKSGYSGKWVYSGGDFDNNVKASSDMDVRAEYDQSVFTVKFIVKGEEYETDTYYKGDKLTLPADPVVEGKEFKGWFIGDTQYHGNETVNSDLTITAKLTNMFCVSFIIREDGEEIERLSQYFRSAGEAIGTMPQNPFVAGKIFEKWVLDGTDTEVNAETVVNGDLTVLAVFREVTVYNLTVRYFYKNDGGNNVVFNTDLISIEAHDLPYTITPPASTKTSDNEVHGGPVYYASQTSVQVQESQFNAEHKYEISIEYVPYTAEYDFVYVLKDLTGNDYTDIEREHIYGVLNSTVTPTIKTYDYAVFENAETVEITQASGQVVKVYYTRKTFSLSYETNGGTYVAGTSALYGSSVSLPTQNPTRSGYTFEGWYSDPELTQRVTGSVTINGDTVLYAKWTGEQVNYTIVYMFEKFNDAGTESSFVYDNSRTGRGQVGTTVTASSAPAITRTGWEPDTAQNNNSSVEIKADGSSVLFVYYKLREYTFQFNAGQYSYYYTNYNVEATLTGKNVTGTGNLNYTMTVKLGQDISSAWPGNVTGRYNSGGNWWPDWHNVSFNGWLNPQENTRYVTKRTIVTEEMLPNSGTTITYTAQWTNNASTYTVNYWLQNADDDGYTKSEEYSQTYTSSGGNLGAKEIAGYTYHHGNSGASGVTQYDFYYNRDTFKIDYYYGSTKLDTIDNVKFDASINRSPYTWAPTQAQCGVDSDYTFAGWYSDAGLTTPYTFNKMPAANLVLYAKWNAPSYTVNFVDDDGTTQLADSQTVEKYKKVSKPANPTKSGYTFDGWYTSTEGNTLFDWNTQITADTTIYAHWVQNILSYTVHYVDEQGNTIASDKVVTNPNLNVGEVVTEQAIAVAGFRPHENSKTITLSGDIANELTFVYGEKSDFTSYTVKYILDPAEYPGEEIIVATSKTVENVPGDTMSVIELAAAVDYSALYEAHPELTGIEFFPDAVEKELVLSSNAANNVFTFKYSSFKNTKVIVHFVDMEGEAIATTSTQVLKVGKTFTLSRTPIAGWELNKAVEGTQYSGTVAGTDYKITETTSEDGLTFTLFYQKKVTITVESQTKQYDGTVLVLPA